jgi:hypothetical protein
MHRDLPALPSLHACLLRAAARGGGLPGMHWDLPACRILLAGCWLAVTIQ